MGNPPRTRKRVHAIRRAPDGSAFENCENCGALMAIALADMHECGSEAKRSVKRFRGVNGNLPGVVKQNLGDQPRETFMKKCKDMEPIEVDRRGFEAWRNMSKEERAPFIIQAHKVNSAYHKCLILEIDDLPWVDDEADSGVVGKFDKFHGDYGYYDCDSLDENLGYDDSDCSCWS